MNTTSKSTIAVGVGKPDYSTSVLSTVEPTAKGTLVRIITSGSLSLPGAYTNNFLSISLLFPDTNSYAAPKYPYHFFNAWATIVSPNTSAQVYLYMAEYPSVANLLTQQNTISKGTNQGILGTDLTWTKGFQTSPGKGYSLIVYVTDGGFNAFKLFYGLCGLADVTRLVTT